MRFLHFLSMFGLLAAAPAQAALISGGNKPLIVLTQSVSESGAETVKVTLATPRSMGKGMSGNLAARSVRDPSKLFSPVATPASLVSTVYSGNKAAQDAVNSLLRAEIDKRKAGYVPAMQTRGAGGMIYQYRVRLRVTPPIPLGCDGDTSTGGGMGQVRIGGMLPAEVAGGDCPPAGTTPEPEIRDVSATAWIHPDGGVSYIGSAITGGVDRIVSAIYSPLAPAGGLPADWKYPDAGTLKITLYRANPDGTWTAEEDRTFSHSGEYDGPDPLGNTDSGENLDHGMYLLVTELLLPYIERNSALYAILDYGRRVRPAMLDQADGTQAAAFQITADQRAYFKAGCGNPPSLYESGSYSAQLTFQVDRYLIQPDSASLLMGSESVDQPSPVQAFEKATYLTDDATADMLSHTLIDPLVTDELYDYRADGVNGLPANFYNVAALAEKTPVCQ